MPWKIEQRGNEYCVIKKSDGSNKGCHPTQDEAEKHLRALYASEKMSQQYGFDPFASLQGVLTGKPFKILPQGIFYRGEKVLNIDESVLREIASNVKIGLPRFRIPINQDHRHDAGKIGTIQDVEYLPAGEDGAGLYATKYDLTDKGKKLITEDGYDAPSAELIWTKNDGQKYQDPETGKHHDNCLVGVAVTPVPFFGHRNVSLYSANLERGKLANEEDELINIANRLNILQEQFEDWKVNMSAHMTTEEMVKKMEAEGMTPEEIKKKLAAMKEKTNMAEETIVAPVVPAVSVDEFNALKSKAEAFDTAMKKQAEEFDAKLKAEKERADTFATQFAAERKARAIETLNVKAQKLSWLPIKPDEYAEKFYELGELKPELAKWFAEKFDAVEKLLAQSALFGQVSHDNADVGVDTIDAIANKIVAEKFSGDMTKYKDALSEAGKLRPDLAKAGLMSR